jgi:hypothetical protein
MIDFWTLLLIIALLTGVWGWHVSLFNNLVIWAMMWFEGEDINWGSDVAWTYAIPFVWVFAICEIILLYRVE